MRDYIIRRLLILIPVMIGVSLLTFSLFNVIPGDACVLRLGFGSTPETLEDCREQHGLNRPLFPITVNSDLPLVHVQESQYGGWLTGISSLTRTSASRWLKVAPGCPPNSSAGCRSPLN